MTDDELRALLEATATETRRHFDGAVEAMQGDVQTLAESLAGLEQKIDSRFAGVKREFEDTRALIKLSYSQLDRRIEALEHGHG